MDWRDVIVLAWLEFNTVTIVALFLMVHSRHRSLGTRMDALHLAEQLQLVVSVVNSDLAKNNRELRQALDAAILCFEENKVLMDRHWNEYNKLKHL